MAPPLRKTPVSQRPRLPSRFSEWLEGLGAWRNTLLGAAAIAALFVCYRIAVVRPILAQVLAFGFPIVALGSSFLVFREPPGPDRLGRIALGVGALLLVVAELSLGLVFYPPAPTGNLTLTPRATDGDIRIPDSVHDVMLQIRGKLAEASAGEGTYELVVTRAGGYHRDLMGKFERVVSHGRRAMRGMAPSQSVTTTEIVREELIAAGHGPLHLKLISVEGAVRPAVRVSAFRESPLLHITPFVTVALAGILLLIEVFFAKRGRVVPLSSGAITTLTLALYIGFRGLNPDDPLSTLTGALIVSLVAGGVGGFLLGRAAGMLVQTADDAPKRPQSKRPSR